MADKKSLWKKFDSNRNQVNRNNLIVSYQPLVRSIARKIKERLPPMVELDDLISYGNFGLIEAIDRFDPSRGFQFETFAVKRIQGAVYDGIRRMDWVPRAVRLQNRQLDAAMNDFQRKYGRQPTDQELMKVLDWPEKKLQKAREDAYGDVVIGLSDTLPGSDDRTITVADVLSDPTQTLVADLELAEVKQSLIDAIENLPERDRIVLGLYYHEMLKFSEIAELFDVSESRICQIHISAIESIKEAMSS